MYALGLDWISTKKGWAFCKLSLKGQQSQIELGTLPIGHESGKLITDASNVVIDAPIGLPDTSQVAMQLRACDHAARSWIGPDLRGTVFPAPVLDELHAWRAIRITGAKQKQGHSRGLLPAIDSASLICESNLNVLESHPELVFSSLYGKPLPRIASKANIFGQSVRLAILKTVAKLDFTLDDYSRLMPALGVVSSDNFIDAIAMAAVANAWSVNGTVQVLISANGTPEPLPSNQAQWLRLMALPSPHLNSSRQAVATPEELLSIATAWMRG